MVKNLAHPILGRIPHHYVRHLRTMTIFRNWKWVTGFVLLLVYLGIIIIVFIANAITGSTALVAYPTAAPTPDGQTLIIQSRNEHRWMQTLYHIEKQALSTGWTPDLYRQAGDIWWNMDDTSRAIPYWSSALESIDDVDLLRTVANVYINLGQWTEVRQTLDQLLALKPNDEWSNYQMGLILAPFNPIKSKLFFDAVPSDSPFRQVIVIIRNELSTQPEDPLISFRVGLALISLDQWAYAELAFQQASDVSFPNPQALAYLGWVKSRQGKDGNLWIDQATQLAPENPEVWYIRGLHFRAQADYVQSLDAIAQSVRLAPNNAGLYAELGTAFRLIGDLEQAEYWLDFAVSASANTPEHQQILENFYVETAYVSPNEIIDSLESPATTSDNPDLIAAYGWALHTTGDSEAGLAQIERALEIDSINNRALFDKARILLETDRQAEAIPILERIAQTYTPFGADAQVLLATIAQE
jgi:tetratricopeptide (TPR) repeat protein